jgi:hypothetical protein
MKFVYDGEKVMLTKITFLYRVMETAFQGLQFSVTPFCKSNEEM